MARIVSESDGQSDSAGGRIVKQAGEYAGEFGLELHGSVHKRGWFTAMGNLRRANEEPKPVPWSRNRRRP